MLKHLTIILALLMTVGTPATSAEDVSWTCKAPKTKSQYTVFADMMVQITKDGDVLNYTCKTGFCVNFYEDRKLKLTTHTTIELFYNSESVQTGVFKPRAFRERFYLRFSDGKILIPPSREDIQTLRCERL